MTQNVIPFIIRTEGDSVVIDIPSPQIKVSPEVARSLGEHLISVAKELAQDEPSKSADERVPKPSDVPPPPVREVKPPQPESRSSDQSPPSGHVRFSGKVMGHINRHDLIIQDLIDVVEHPDETWKDPGGSDAIIAVRNDQSMGVVHFDDGNQIYVVSVRDRWKLYDLRREAGSGTGLRHSGGPGKTGISTLSEFIKAASSKGLVVTKNSNHATVHLPENPKKAIPVPLTPSDHRSWKNLVAQVRNELGVDLCS